MVKAEPHAIALVIVSHSASIAGGVVELVSQVAQQGVALIAIGGTVGGGLGTDPGVLRAALRKCARNGGGVVLMDIGSSVLSVRAAFAELGPDERDRLRVVDAPLVEGAVAAAAVAATGASLDDVAHAAENARHVTKF